VQPRRNRTHRHEPARDVTRTVSQLAAAVSEGTRRHRTTRIGTNGRRPPVEQGTRGKAVSQTGSAVRLVAVQPACSPRSNPPPGPGHNVRRCLSDAAAPAVTRRTGAAGIISGDYPAASHTCGRLHRRPRRLRPGDLRLVTGTGSALGTGHSRGPRAPASTPYTLSIAR
jgi:hypothetical protein